MPGEQFVYRFVAEDAGTYWYHSHQVSHEQVRRGLLGALVIQPEVPDPEVQEAARGPAPVRRRGDGQRRGGHDHRRRRARPAVRVRVVNTNNGLASVWVTGAPYRVLAVDGCDVNEPGEIEDEKYGLPAGGRFDLGFVVPEDGMRVDFAGATAMVFGGDPTGGDGPRAPRRPSTCCPTARRPSSTSTQRAGPAVRLPHRPAPRLPGRPARPVVDDQRPPVPGHPDVHGQEGDVVVFEIDNRSGENHPMHLHGHHAVVLSRDGEPATGSPVVGRLPRGQGRRDLRDRVRGRQPRHLDGPLPQPAARGGGAGRPPDVHRRGVVVPGRRQARATSPSDPAGSADDTQPTRIGISISSDVSEPCRPTRLIS